MNNWGKAVDVAVIANMEAIKKQATKLREQVARQQQVRIFYIFYFYFLFFLHGDEIID